MSCRHLEWGEWSEFTDCEEQFPLVKKMVKVLELCVVIGLALAEVGGKA